MGIMKKRILTVAALVTIGALNIGIAHAVDVTSWSELNTNKNAESIEFKSDITATSNTYPSPISLTSTTEQTIEGNYHSFSSQDRYEDRWYYYSLNLANTYQGTLNIKNLGKYSDGSADNNTFSYTDIDGNTVYKNIDASVNNWKGYFLTLGKPITTNITNSVFANNGKDKDAKLIYASGSGVGTLNIKDSIFYNNNVANVSGVVSGNKNNLNVENTIFYNNRNSTTSGGALYSNGIVTIKNSHFINNVAEKDTGGAISLGNAATLTIEGSLFKGNVSNDEGGVISGYGSSTIALIKDSQFINNHNGGTYYDGGAISLSGGYIQTVDNVLFEGNRACSKGGGLYQGMNGSNTKPPILIKDTIFKNNEASTGGGYYTDGQGRKNYTYITDSEFTNNIVKATDHYMEFNIPVGGGMISAGNVPIIINNASFTENTAIPDGNNTYSAGGAIYFSGGSADYPLKIVDSTFTDNSALEGGAIYIENADTALIAQTKDIIFSGNTAGADTDDYNGGADIYFDTNSYSATLSLNAANEKKIVFNGSVAAYQGGNTPIIDINNSGITYNTYDGETETPVTAETSGEIQFNARVGDATQYFTAINLYGGTLSIGQNATNNANTDNPDGYMNDNNFYVKGDSILNTVNNVIGEFAPKVFDIEDGTTLDYKFDVDLVNAKSDKLAITENNGTLRLSSFNVISDSNAAELKIKYSDTNVNGIVHDDYTITTSTETYDVTAENGNNGSYIVFASTSAGGGLAAAIAAESDQYIITNDSDENVSAWKTEDGNVIKKDMDINANGHSIYTENGIDGMVVSDGTTVSLRDVKKLSGFNNPLTNNGGTLSVIDSDIKGNTGAADINNNGGNVTINAETKDVTIGSENTENALISDGGTVDVTGSNKVTFDGNVKGQNGAQMNISTDTEFNGDVALSGGSAMDISAESTFNSNVALSGDSVIAIAAATMFNGDVNGSDGASVNIDADTTFNGNVTDTNINQSGGTVGVNALSGAKYSMSNGVLNLSDSGNFAPDTFELNDGTVNIAAESAFMPQENVFSDGNINAINNKTGNLNFNSLTLKNAINLAVDIDMKKQIMDTISASSVKGNGRIKVNEFNVLSDSDKSKFSILFADDKLKDRVSTDVKTLEGKIFKYNVAYDKETGRFNIIGGGGNSEGYDPSVMASPIAAQLQGYFTQLNSYDEAFRNMDMYMLLPYNVRQAMKLRNKVAISSSDYVYDDNKTIYDDKTGWVRTHTTFENVPLKNGPNVSNVAYGTFFGGESELYDLGKGWEGMWGLYAGYNGSHQAYNGVSMYQNGGTLGILGMAYKGNFFQGLTINTGANGGEASSRFGNEDFAMLMAGVASKTGYNIEFKEGKLIVQPSLLMSYSFVNSFDYTNAAGINISSDPLHAIQIEPNVKFIANLKNGWQPYAGVGMVWNIMDKTHYMANTVSLPELSVKPYVKYGVGIRKSWGERFTGFFQTYITNGGRNGVGLQLGFRWALGSNKPNTKVLDNETTTLTGKKEIKTLSSHYTNEKKRLTSNINY